MRVELIEQLRCPVAHAPSPLVTIVHERRGDQLQRATLGCPICGERYDLRNGVVHFGVVHFGVVHFGDRARVVARDAHAVEHAVDPVRIAALLALDAPGVRVALCGTLARVADELEATTDVRVVAINAPSDAESFDADALTLSVEQALPFADRSLHALAVDDAHVSVLRDAARVVRVGGRVLAPVAAELPAGCVELARDASEWVAEVQASVSAPVSLGRSAVRPH